MKDVLVTVVMPVYNSEVYLKESLDSLINQKYQNIEIICVDDGSTDDSLRILEDYQNRDKRIKVLKQKNQFAGVARNNGMKHANGKYIMFLDSDDIFERNMIYNLVRKAEKHNTDIIFFGFYHFTNNINKRSMMGIPYKNKKIISPLEKKDTIFQIAQGIPWNKFYNKNFILNSGVKFQDLSSNNDIFFSKMTALVADKILFDNKRYTNYRIGNKKSTQGSYKLSSGNYTKSIVSMYEEMIKRDIYEIYEESFQKYVLDSFLEIFLKCDDFQSHNIVINKISKALVYMNIDNSNKVLDSHSARNIFNKILENDLEGTISEHIMYLKSNFISKKSIEYRLGKEALKRFKIKVYE